MNFSKLFLFLVAVLSFIPSTGLAKTVSSPFNQLVLEKADIEKRFGVQTLECFPFIRKIGFTEDQNTFIKNCLSGVHTLKKALREVPGAKYKIIGITSRFLRTGGFHTVLVPWNASKEDMIRFLENPLTAEEQNLFLDKIYSRKREIVKKIRARQLYCSMEISNEQCLTGYENLAAVIPVEGLKKINWEAIVITDLPGPGKKPDMLMLGYNQSPSEMSKHLLTDINKVWSKRKKMYEEIESRFEDVFNKRLHIAKFVCPPQLTRKQCLLGATNLRDASQDEDMQRKFWGNVTLDPHNTIIKDDFDVVLRFDLPAEEIVRQFSRKSSRRQTTEKNVLAEKLEGRTKNNPTRLRTVCDLEGIQSVLCAQAFETFIEFVKANRDFRIRKPWSVLMFIDGTQLSRVNFALNSPARDTYLYIDAASGIDEFKNFLSRFGEEKRE